jgi:NAD(P)-dependent dehydrogenase (short-subunit alcohol dehydrogenase family)
MKDLTGKVAIITVGASGMGCSALLLFAQALEFARDRIRVNCIAPGGISTPILFGIGGSIQYGPYAGRRWWRNRRTQGCCAKNGPESQVSFRGAVVRELW